MVFSGEKTVQVIGGTEIACEACRAQHMKVSGGMDAIGSHVQAVSSSRKDNERGI